MIEKTKISLHSRNLAEASSDAALLGVASANPSLEGVSPVAWVGFKQLVERLPFAGGLADLFRFLAVALQLGLLVLIIQQYEIESRAFFHLAVLTFVGFVIHAWLPLRY